MAIANVKFESKVLGKETAFNVIIPEKNYEGPYKCLYLLHGLGDDENNWINNSGIAGYAEQYGIMVVTPRAEASFYSNMSSGPRYYDHIAYEIPMAVRSMFNVSTKQEDNFIAGLSMGGYGALKIGLRECGQYAAIGSLSPCGDIKKLEGFDFFLKPIFGEDINVPDEDDVLYLAKQAEDDPTRPRVFLGIGYSDFLYENDKPVRAFFEGSSYDYTYRESEGMHNWAFWDEYIQYVLQWMLEG